MAAASHETTPDSGSLPMSVLWTTLPVELKEQILSEAVPRRLDLHVTRFLPRFITGVGHESMFGKRPPEAYDTALKESSAITTAWKCVAALTFISQGSRDRALDTMRTQTCIIITAERNQMPGHPFTLQYSEWFRRCNRVFFEEQRYIHFTERIRPTHGTADIKRKSTDLCLTTSLEVFGEQLELSRLPKFDWSIKIGETSARYLAALHRFMASYESNARRIYSISIGNVRARLLRYVGPRDSRLIREAFELLCQALSRFGLTGRAIISMMHPLEDLGLGNHEPWKCTSIVEMKRWEEDVGRKEILEVLWVFLPYLQPEWDDESEELA